MLSRQDVKIGGLQASCYTSQGGRKYMEDCFNVAYDYSLHGYGEYAFFGVFDGHGGPEASMFARDCLKRSIIQQKIFWSDNDDDVLRAIRQGFIATHYAMWRAQDKWPKTSKGFPSTSGTTASVAFYKNNKLYIGHVGDSGIALGYQEEGEKNWRAHQLTQDHKPECNVEKARIINSGGKVVIKSGVPRIVWNRPRVGHKGPVRRSTPIDEIPFLAVARSLGDLWSYNSSLNKFVVSPDPDVHVVPIDRKKFRCLVFGTDGLWNVVSAEPAVNEVKTVTEAFNYHPEMDYSVSQYLVEGAIMRWEKIKMRADNICVLVVTVNPDTIKSPNIPLKRKLSMNLKESPSSISIHSRNVHDSMWNENCQTSTSNMIHNLTRYDRPGEELGYMNSFAESYNLLYENSLYNIPDNESHNPALMRHQTANGEDLNFNTETYSLTKLQTRSEQINSLIEEDYSLSLDFHDFHGLPYFFNDDDQHHQNRTHQCDTPLLNSIEINLPLADDHATKSHNRVIYDSHQHHHSHATRSIRINEITSNSIANDDEYIHSSSSTSVCRNRQSSDSSNSVLVEHNLDIGPMNSKVVVNKKPSSSPESGVIAPRNRVVPGIDHTNNLRTRRQKLVSLYKLGPPVTRSKDLLFKKKLLVNGSSSTKSVQTWAKKKMNLKLRKSTVQSVIPSKKQQQKTNNSNSSSNSNMTSSNNSRHRTCKYLKAIKSPKKIHLLIHPIKNN